MKFQEYKMFQRFFIKASPKSTNSRNTSPEIAISNKRSNFLSVLQHTMMVTGITAITALALMFMKPELTNKFQAISPFFNQDVTSEDATPAPTVAITTEKEADQPITPQNAKLLADEKQQQTVSNWLSKRYRVANDAANKFVSAAYVIAKEYKLDPLLILSVMAIESGLNPFAESPVGAQGLMQVMAKVHQDKFEDLGGVKAALDPEANIRVGSQILKEYVTRGGSVEAGLKMYVGAALKENDGGYGSKVLAEYRRLKEVSKGKSVPIYTTTNSSVIAATKAPSISVKESQLEAKQVAEI